MLPSAKIDVREYLDANGRSLNAQWFDGLNAQAAAKVAIAVTRLVQGKFFQHEGSRIRSL